jgi:hypothetical protein
MKKLMTVFALALVAAPMANAAVLRADAVHAMQVTMLKYAMSKVSVQDLINWKVGDTASYNISVSSFGNLGTSVKSVTSDTGTALWIDQTMALSGQNQTVDILMNKADGKILEVKQNGQDVQIPDDKVTVISQDYTSITVPAGTFKCLHIVGSSTQASHLEVWMNPTDTVMDGSIQESMEMAQLGNMTMTLSLTSFKKN